MFCSWCGASNADNAITCGQCGKSLQSTQPGPGQLGQTVVTNVPNYLVPAILVTVLCCLPAGIPAIVYAAQVNGKLQAGDIAGAQLASKNAKLWCWISAGAGLFVVICYVGLILLGVMNKYH